MKPTQPITMYATTFDSFQKVWHKADKIATKKRPVIIFCKGKQISIKCTGPWRAKNPTQST